MANGRVTLRDVYGATAALEAKIDRRFDKMDKSLASISKDYGERISTIELWKANLAGKITLATAIFSLVFTLAWDYLRKQL